MAVITELVELTLQFYGVDLAVIAQISGHFTQSVAVIKRVSIFKKIIMWQ